MPDYEKMYLHLSRETEKALRILVKAQQACEDMFVKAVESDLAAAGEPPSAVEEGDN